MKKLIAMLLALAMVFAMTACGAAENNEPATEATTEAATEAATEATEEVTEEVTEEIVEGEGETMEMSAMDALLNRIVEENPVQFMGGNIPVDLADADSVKYFTGLDSAENIESVGVYEPMIGSIAFSMVAVEVAEGADAKAVAEAMKSGIDTRKWICVEAESLMVAGSGNTVLLVMCDNAQPFVDAFQTVIGAELDFVI